MKLTRKPKALWYSLCGAALVLSLGACGGHKGDTEKGNPEEEEEYGGAAGGATESEGESEEDNSSVTRRLRGVYVLTNCLEDKKGGYCFTYDEMGRCIGVMQRPDEGPDKDLCRMAYDPFSLFVDGRPATVELNSAGYISKLELTNGGNGGHDYSAMYSYDPFGHLAGINFTDTYQGKARKGNVILTWKEGNLLRVNEVSTGSGGSSADHSFAYGKVKNKKKVFPRSMARYLGMDEDPILESLTLLGMLGTGPANLPEQITDTKKGETGRITCEVDEEGLLQTEQVNNRILRYTFAPAGSAVSMGK